MVQLLFLFFIFFLSSFLLSQGHHGENDLGHLVLLLRGGLLVFGLQHVGPVVVSDQHGGPLVVGLLDGNWTISSDILDRNWMISVTWDRSPRRRLGLPDVDSISAT